MMYITCTKCSTKFVVAEKQIGDQGKKVRCSKCSHVWYQKLENNVHVKPVLTTPKAVTSFNKEGFDKGVNLPALLPIKFPPYLFVMPILIIGLIIFMLTMLLPNKLEFNSLFDNNVVSIKDLQIVNQKDSNKITVSYKLYNASPKKIKIPLVRIRLFDKNNKVLKSFINKHKNIHLSPDQSIQAKAKFFSAPQSVDNIDIMIGNKIDFILN